MSDEPIRPGQVSATPEGGPVDEGAPAQEPGLGQVQSTPEAAPLSESEELRPPTWQEQGQAAAPAASAPAAAREEDTETSEAPTAAFQAGEEPSTRPSYTGKPVSEVQWDALRYAAPVVAQAEKLTIKAIDLSGRGLSRFARYLETRRQERDAAQKQESEGDR